MINTAENMEWENEAPTLGKMKKHNHFSVPEYYFDELDERINHAIFINSLKEQHTESDFTTPANYFQTLENQIHSRIILAQHETSQKQSFQVPEGYFDQLQENIQAKTTSAKKSIKLWQQPVFRYAVAASLVLATTASWFINNDYQKAQLHTEELAKEQLLYDIDESVILEYVQENQNARTAKATEGEIEAYILDNFSSSDLSNNL